MNHTKKEAADNPLVSIIIPNYNNEQYLDACLGSCLAQTYDNIEIIIVDDCSTDRSVELLKRYREGDHRIHLFENRENLKVSKTRHIGIEHASGSWITTLDSDDIFLTDRKIEKEMQVVAKHGYDPFVVAYSGILPIDENDKIYLGKTKYKPIKERNIHDELLTRSCFIPRDFIFSKKLYYEVGGFDFDIPLYEDWDLKIRLSKKGRFFYSGIDGVGYRRHGLGLSSASRKIHCRWLYYVFEKNAEGLVDKIELKKILKQNIKPSILRKIKNVLWKWR